MAILHFSAEGFDKAIAGSDLVVVDFWAAWCGPCKMLAPVMEQLATQYEGKAIFGKVNTDDVPELAARYGIVSIPTVLFFRNGQELERKIGVMPPERYVETLNAQL